MPSLAINDVALFRHLPVLAGQIPWSRVGHWPTPVALLTDKGGLPPLYVKREDLSNPVYGGNKIRTIEPVFGLAKMRGATRIWATGAYGSNHAMATITHAGSVGLTPALYVFPQPPSSAACANAMAALASGAVIRCMHSVVELPLVMAALARQPHTFVMAPGAASPVGALGSLSAALELAEQVDAGLCPSPHHIVLPVGSTCTTAGLLAGLHLAADLGIAFTHRIPNVVAVRVTPWPITSAIRIAHLAYRTLRALWATAGGRGAIPTVTTLGQALVVDGRYLGGGYGRATAAGYRASQLFQFRNGLALDPVYAAKAGAGLLDIWSNSRGPVLFWSTKSSAPLPRATIADLDSGPKALRNWLAIAGYGA